MLGQEDHVYYERRYAQEVERATAAAVPEVAAAHRALADQYAQRLNGGAKPRLELVNND